MATLAEITRDAWPRVPVCIVVGRPSNPIERLLLSHIRHFSSSLAWLISLPYQPGHSEFARQRERSGAQGKPAPGELDGPFLVAPNPVWEQREFHVVNDAVALERVAACVRHKALDGSRLVLHRSAEDVGGGKRRAAGSRDRDREVTITAVEEISDGIRPHR